MIGYELLGSGESGVLILNDWIGDTSTWDNAHPYLDTDRFTWVFADLRGYGRSRGQTGKHTLEEAAADAVAVANALRWSRFSIIGHSMSTLVALHLAQQLPDRVERAVVVTPPPPTSLGVDDATFEALRDVALGDDARRMGIMKMMWGTRLSDGWIRFKVERWRAAAEPEAVAAYLSMFARDGLPHPQMPITVPVLAVTGEQDTEIMRSEPVARLLAPLCQQLTVAPITDCGHYPMQETPPLFVATVERFLAT